MSVTRKLTVKGTNFLPREREVVKDMQPTYIKAMWIGVAALIFAAQTFGVVATKLHREYLHAFSFGALVVACAVTLLHNKIKFGVFLPGIKKKQ